MDLPKEPDTTPQYYYNPSKEDFTYPFNGKDFTFPSRKIVQFPKFLGDHLAKHLASKLALEEETKIHYEDKVKRWLNKINVKI